MSLTSDFLDEFAHRLQNIVIFEEITPELDIKVKSLATRMGISIKSIDFHDNIYTVYFIYDNKHFLIDIRRNPDIKHV